jgi:hypothetical protein
VQPTAPSPAKGDAIAAEFADDTTVGGSLAILKKKN